MKHIDDYAKGYLECYVNNSSFEKCIHRILEAYEYTYFRGLKEYDYSEVMDEIIDLVIDKFDLTWKEGTEEIDSIFLDSIYLEINKGIQDGNRIDETIVDAILRHPGEFNKFMEKCKKPSH